MHLWFWQMVRITLRRGVGLHMGVLGGLAGIVSFVRSYNMAWSQRGSSNFMLSLAVSLMGMVGVRWPACLPACLPAWACRAD